MTIAVLVGLAIVDSINPSAILITLYLLATPGTGAQVGLYIATIWLTYFSIGLMALMGLELIRPSTGDVLSSVPGLIAQGVVGLALLVYTLRAPTPRQAGPPAAPPSARTYAATALLGVTVTAMELPTALPYIAAIAVLTEANLPIRQSVPLLCLYNAIFVLPPVVLLAGHLFFIDRLRQRYADLSVRLQAGAQELGLWVAGLIGSALLLTSAIELIARTMTR